MHEPAAINLLSFWRSLRWGRT